MSASEREAGFECCHSWQLLSAIEDRSSYFSEYEEGADIF